jgi:hypothetical protein
MQCFDLANNVRDPALVNAVARAKTALGGI